MLAKQATIPNQKIVLLRDDIDLTDGLAVIESNQTSREVGKGLTCYMRYRSCSQFIAVADILGQKRAALL
jgi:hypothetical protein